MYKYNGYAGQATRIDLQPWLWILGLSLLLAVVLAGQAARYFWRDSLEIEGRVRHFATQEPIADAFVEVVWEDVQAPFARRLHRTVVKTDDAGRYRARLPETLVLPATENHHDKQGHPAPVRAFTARVYKPGYRHLKSSLLFHHPFNDHFGEERSSRWDQLDWEVWARGGITIEIEEPDARDRAGDVRLVPVTESDTQRLRQLYGTFVTLTLSSGGTPAALEQEWMAALCHEASGLYLIAAGDLQLRTDLCRVGSKVQ